MRKLFDKIVGFAKDHKIITALILFALLLNVGETEVNHFSKAKTKMNNQKYQESIKQYEKALESFDQDSETSKAKIKSGLKKAKSKLKKKQQAQKEKLKKERKAKREKLGKKIKKNINFVDLSDAKNNLEKLAEIPNTKDKHVYTHNKDRYDRRKAVADKIGEPKRTWGNYPRAVRDYLKKRLKDPDSLEFLRRNFYNYEKDNGRYYWTVTVEYKAKNSFGGYVRSQKTFRIRNNTVVSVD